MIKHEAIKTDEPVLKIYYIHIAKDYKGVYRLASKIKDKGFEADLFKKH
jgi:hypothetical protein